MKLLPYFLLIVKNLYFQIVKLFFMLKLKEAVCALIHGPNGGVIAVSRKDNHQSMGMIGGKVDGGETPEEALIRETYEETGLTITGYKKIFERKDAEFICYTYLCSAIGTITNSNEISEAKGLVKEVDWSDLFSGSFGEYNRELYNYLIKLNKNNE